ncbi:MAG: hypothetical protein SH821_10760 [Phototrophicales bacterium]|nr:hypothetical protein [Phototrophicales bacterium]
MRLLSRFVILLTICLLSVTVIHAQTEQIVLGQAVRGEITAIQPTSTYIFEGREGDIIYFYVAAAQNNQQFSARLFDANSNLLAETTVFPFINNFTLPATQTYSLLISDPDNGTGAFTAIVDFYLPTAIVLNTELSGSFASPAHLQFFTIDAQADTLFRYSSTGTQLGISVIDPQGELSSFQGMYDSPLLMLSQFEQTGQYIFMVHTDLPTGGEYRLFLESVIPTPLVGGTPVTGSRQINNPPVFSFDSPAGKTWELNATLPSNGSRQMVIAQLDGRIWYDVIIAVDDGSGANGNPRISPFIAPADATYYVWLNYSPYANGVSSYEYELLLSSTTILSLAPDVETTHTITPTSGALTFVYSPAVENERIQVEIRRVSETGALTLQIVSPVDDVLLVNGRGMNGGVFDLNLPVMGIYRFVVNDIDYDPTELVITIRLSILQDKS